MVRALLLTLIVAVLTAIATPVPAHIDASQALARWPRLGVLLATPAPADRNIIEALEQDVAAREVGSDGACIELGGLLLNGSIHVALEDVPSLRVRIFDLCTRRIDPTHSRFWTEFTRATLLDRAGRPDRVAESLARALNYAHTENVDPQTIAMTTGFLGHAQQSAGLVIQAHDVFQRMRSDRFERNHARSHLGEIALQSGGIDAALSTWFGHPDGLTASVTLVVEEADKLWRLDPDLSYDLVARAIALIEERRNLEADPALVYALARLKARTRENAITRRSPSGAEASKAPSGRLTLPSN